MRIVSLVAGVILLGIGVFVLYFYFSSPLLGTVSNVSSSLGLNVSAVLIIPGIFALIGLVLIANGFRSNPTKLTVKDVKELGLTGYQIKEAGSTKIPVVVTGSQILEKKLSSLELTILREISGGKNVDDLSKDTGVEPSIISSKIAGLSADGYLTQNNKLTEKGFETLQRTD